jgi:Zn-dependent M28 family amino/carboxypeptidase
MLLLIFNLSLQVNARTPSTFGSLKNELQKVSDKNLLEWVNGLLKVSSPSRMVGLPGHDRARDYLKEEILKADVLKSGQLTITSTQPLIEEVKKFYQHDFDHKVEGKIPSHHPDYQKWQRFTLFMKKLVDSRKSIPVQNVIWEKKGMNSDKELVVSAHYDTISHDKETLLVNESSSMPGANYNATGVAVALGLIKILSQIDLNYTVKVVFLDWQGIGFHGSQIYAKELKNSGKDILGVVNLEMLGQDTTYFDKKKKSGNMCAYLRNQSDEQIWVKNLLEKGSKVTQKVSFEMRPNGFENSDNIRFWDEGFKSVTLSQNWEEDFNPKFYQTPDDTAETLNHGTLWSSYQFIAGAVVGTLLDLTR